MSWEFWFVFCYKSGSKTFRIFVHYAKTIQRFVNRSKDLHECMHACIGTRKASLESGVKANYVFLPDFTELQAPDTTSYCQAPALHQHIYREGGTKVKWSSLSIQVQNKGKLIPLFVLLCITEPEVYMCRSPKTWRRLYGSQKGVWTDKSSQSTTIPFFITSSAVGRRR